MIAVYVSVLLFVLASLGVIIFSISGIINFLRREPSMSDWKKALIFFILAIIFFFMIGIVNVIEDYPGAPPTDTQIKEQHVMHQSGTHHPSF
jgi:hypothetical protein